MNHPAGTPHFPGLPSVRKDRDQGPVSNQVIEPQAAVLFGGRKHGRGKFWPGHILIKCVGRVEPIGYTGGVYGHLNVYVFDFNPSKTDQRSASGSPRSSRCKLHCPATPRWVLLGRSVMCSQNYISPELPPGAEPDDHHLAVQRWPLRSNISRCNAIAVSVDSLVGDFCTPIILFTKRDQLHPNPSGK